MHCHLTIVSLQFRFTPAGVLLWFPVNHLNIFTLTSSSDLCYPSIYSYTYFYHTTLVVN